MMGASIHDVTPVDEAHRSVLEWVAANETDGAAVPQKDTFRFRCPACDGKNADYQTQKDTWHCFNCDRGGGWTDLAKAIGTDLSVGSGYPKKAASAKTKKKRGPLRLVKDGPPKGVDAADLTGAVPDLESLAGSWPYNVAKGVYPFVDRNQAHVYDEIAMPDGDGPKRLTVRRTPHGIVCGLSGGTYYRKGKGRVWSALPPVDGTEAPKLWFPEEPRRPLYRMPELRRLTSRSIKGEQAPLVLLCAGPKDADAALELGFDTTTKGQGESSSIKHHIDAFHGLTVAVVYDNDKTGKRYAQRDVAALRAARIEAAVVAPLGTRRGYDLSDYIHDQRTAGQDDRAIADALARLIDVALEDARRDARSKRAQIIITTHEADVTDTMLEVLAERESNLFVRAQALVQVTTDPAPKTPKVKVRRPPGAPRIVRVTDAGLRDAACRHIDFVKLGDDGDTRLAHPPAWLFKGALARPAWPGVPFLTTITESPILRPDGTIFQTPGHDPETGALFVQPAGVEFDPVPESPSRKDAKSAADALLEVVKDFPFEAEEHRAVWLAAVLTAVGREAFAGNAPLILTDASTPGSGKTLLMDTVATIATGRSAAKTAWSWSAQEQTKTVTTLLLEGAPIVLFDNLTGRFGGGILDLLLTAEEWRGRILGASESRTLPNRTLWLASGNNVTLGGDTVRRSLHIRLAPNVERPEERDEFEHPHLLSWVKGARGRLLPAALTILREFFLATKPHERGLDALRDDQRKLGLKPLGMAEEWSAIIRTCVVRLGFPDPAATRIGLLENASQDHVDLAELVEALAEYIDARNGRPATAAEIANDLQEGSTLADAIDVASRRKRGGMPNSRDVGRALGSHRGRVVEGKCIESAGSQQRALLWTVTKK